MAKRVVVVASGETERRAIPHLVAHLRDNAISVDEVRIPTRHRALNAEMAERLMKAAWYRNAGAAFDKFVVLVDADGKAPGDVLDAFKDVPQRLGPEITADVKFAYAQWCLEAWFFADANNLRNYVGGSLGRIDTSQPDEITNPKLQLRNALKDRVYTAQISEEIARTLDAPTIGQRSASFRGFVDAIKNGNARLDSDDA